MTKRSFTIDKLRFWERKPEQVDQADSKEQPYHYSRTISFEDESVTLSQLRNTILLNPFVLYFPRPALITGSVQEFEISFYAVSRQKGLLVETQLLTQYRGSIVSPA